MGWTVLGGILGGLILLFLVIWYGLAPSNRWFTFVKEGSAKIIVRGDKFEKALIQWEGHTFSHVGGVAERWEVIEGEEPWHLLGGFRPYSLFWPVFDVYTHQFRWTHLHEDGAVVAHSEWLDFVLLKEDLYVIELPLEEEGGAEDANGVPLGISIVLPMRIINPYVALFIVRRWLPMVTGVVQARLRQFVANYRYKEDLLNMRAGEGIVELQEKKGLSEGERDKPGANLWEKFWEVLVTDFQKGGGLVLLAEGVVRIYGVEINKNRAGVLKIDPGKKYRELTTLEYDASQKKKRTIIDAEAVKEKLRIEAEGEKLRIDTVYGAIESFKDSGELIRALEAMEKSPLAASVTIQAIPGLQELLRGVFGGRPPETVSPQEFRELKDKIEQLLKE